MPVTRNYGSVVAATHAVSLVPIRIFEVYGNFNGAADRWLQFHPKASPSDGDTPIVASLLMSVDAMGKGFKYSFPNGLLLQVPASATVSEAHPICARVSTAEATLTYDAASTVDLTIVYEEYEQQPVGTIVATAGDLTTQVTNRAAFAHSATQKNRLVKVEAYNNDSGGCPLFLLGFCSSSAPTTDVTVPDFRIAGHDVDGDGNPTGAIDQLETVVAHFGANGEDLLQGPDGGPADFGDIGVLIKATGVRAALTVQASGSSKINKASSTANNGCYLYWSTKADVFSTTATTLATNGIIDGGPIKATYITRP